MPFEHSLKNSFSASHTVHLQNAVLEKIRSGQIVMAPRRSLVLLQRMLWAMHAVMGVLIIAAIVALIHELQTQNTLVYLRETFAGLSDYRELAWSAFVESVPVVTLGLFVTAALGLGISVFTQHRLHKNNLLA